MSVPKGLIVRVKCFCTVCFFVFFLGFSTEVFVFVCLGDEEECTYNYVPSAAHSPRSINRMLSTTSCPPRASFPSVHSQDAGLSVTLAAALEVIRK